MKKIYLSYMDYDLFWEERVKERVLTAYPNCDFQIERVEFISEEKGYMVYVSVKPSIEFLSKKVEELEQRIEVLESNNITEYPVSSQEIIDLYIQCIKEALYFSGGKLYMPIYSHPAAHRVFGNSEKVKKLRKYLQKASPKIDFHNDILPHLNCYARYKTSYFGQICKRVQTYVTLTKRS